MQRHHQPKIHRCFSLVIVWTLFLLRCEKKQMASLNKNGPLRRSMQLQAQRRSMSSWDHWVPWSWELVGFDHQTPGGLKWWTACYKEAILNTYVNSNAAAQMPTFSYETWLITLMSCNLGEDLGLTIPRSEVHHQQSQWSQVWRGEGNCWDDWRVQNMSSLV